MHTLKNLTGFYGDFDFSHQDILRFMDILEENYDEYLSHLFESSNKVIKGIRMYVILTALISILKKNQKMKTSMMKSQVN